MRRAVRTAPPALVALLLLAPAPAMAQPEDASEASEPAARVIMKADDESILLADGVCIYSHFTLAARLTIHAVDSKGQVALALDVIDRFDAAAPQRVSRTIRSETPDGTSRLYGRMQFMVAQTQDGGSRYTAILPRDFLAFFSEAPASRLVIEQDGTPALVIALGPRRVIAMRGLEACTKLLEDGENP